jgi:hypothetical protein
VGTAGQHNPARHPLKLGRGDEYTYDLLINDAVNAVFAPEVWDGPNGAAALFDFVADAVLAGKASAAADVARLHKALANKLRPREANYPNGLDAYYGNQCADKVPARISYLACDRQARGARVAVRAVLVVGQHRVRALAGQRRPLHRTVDSADLVACPGRGELLRRHHRLRRRQGHRPAAA